MSRTPEAVRKRIDSLLKRGAKWGMTTAERGELFVLTHWEKMVVKEMQLPGSVSNSLRAEVYGMRRALDWLAEGKSPRKKAVKRIRVGDAK